MAETGAMSWRSMLPMVVSSFTLTTIASTSSSASSVFHTFTSGRLVADIDLTVRQLSFGGFGQMQMRLFVKTGKLLLPMTFLP